MILHTEEDPNCECERCKENRWDAWRSKISVAQKERWKEKKKTITAQEIVDEVTRQIEEKYREADQ